MIKERWPPYLDADCCTRLTFDYTPKTSGSHLCSVLTTGIAHLYVNDELVFHRPQEQQLQREAFYFYRSKFERRFNYPFEGGKTYTIRLESWATEPDALARTIGGPVIQGSGVRFFESVDVAAQIESAADAAAKADLALIFTGTTVHIHYSIPDHSKEFTRNYYIAYGHNNSCLMFNPISSKCKNCSPSQ